MMSKGAGYDGEWIAVGRVDWFLSHALDMTEGNQEGTAFAVAG